MQEKLENICSLRPKNSSLVQNKQTRFNFLLVFLLILQNCMNLTLQFLVQLPPKTWSYLSIKLHSSQDKYQSILEWRTVKLFVPWLWICPLQPKNLFTSTKNAEFNCFLTLTFLLLLIFKMSMHKWLFQLFFVQISQNFSNVTKKSINQF